MDSTATAERGFTLLEVLVAVGLLATASAATLGAFAALARNAAPPAARDAALDVAENVLARARAAVAYVPPGPQDGTTLIGDRSWGLRPGITTFAAGARLRAAVPCGRAGPLLLRLPVTTAYDAAAERFTVSVTYPRDPCRAAADGSFPSDGTATVTLAQTLPPSAYAPGTTIHRDVAVPARM